MEKISGILSFWALHISPLSPEQRVEFNGYMAVHGQSELLPVSVTGCIVIDHKSRFSKGTAMRSSLLKGFDLQNMLIYTKNSIYQLKGAGEILHENPPISPDEISEAVGRTMLRLNPILGLDLADLDNLKVFH